MKKSLFFLFLLGLILVPKYLLCDDEFIAQYKSDSGLGVRVDGGNVPHCGVNKPLVDGMNGFFFNKAIYDQWNSKPHSFFEVPPYIGPLNSYNPGGKNSYIQKLSKYEYRDGKIVLRNPESLIKTFCREMGEKTLGIRVDWGNSAVCLRTIDDLLNALVHNKKLQKKKLRRLENVFGKGYLYEFARCYRNVLQKRYASESRAKVAKYRVERLQRVERKILSPIGMSLQKTGKVLSDKKRKKFDILRGKLRGKYEASKTYARMFDEAAVQDLHVGCVQEKLYNRLNAFRKARNNRFKKRTAHYSSTYECLKICYGNEVQQNVHGEVVDFVGRYTEYGGDSAFNVEAATEIVLGLRDKLDGSEDSACAKAYERAYSFLDFCWNWLHANVAKNAFYFLKRAGRGFEQGGSDIQEVLQGGVYRFIKNTCDHQEYGLKNSEEIFTDFWERAKEQPLSEVVGDVLESCTRGLVHASALIAAAATIATMVEAGVAVAAGTASAMAVKNLIEPFNVAPSGAAALGNAASSGVSIWQSVVDSVSFGAEALMGLAPAAQGAVLFSQGGPGGVDNSPWINRGDS
jgi:hypothetical protein